MGADSPPLIRKDFAGLLVKGVGMMGGTLVLTWDELLFVLLISRDSLTLSSRVAGLSKKLHDWSAHPQTFLNAAVKPLTKRIRIQLRDVESVEPSRRSAVRIDWLDGSKLRTIEYGIAATR